MSGGDANVSIALATTLGIVGILIWNGMEFCNVFWGNMAVKAAEKGDYKGVIKYHVFGAQLTTFLLRFVPGFLVLYFGADYVISLTNAAPAWTIHALEIVGGVLPAVGITMITSLLIKDGTYWVYFLTGFILITYFELSMVAVAVIAVIFAVIAYKLLGRSNSGDQEEDDMEVEF